MIYTEPGGRMEAQLADWVAEHDSRLPIVAFMAGRFMDDEEMKGMSFGHAGTIVEGKEDTATEKIARLEAAGHPGGRAHRRDPRRGAREAGSAGLMPGLFIDVRGGRRACAATPSSPRSSRRSARLTSTRPPAPASRSVEQPARRVRALRALPRGGARRRGAGDQALRRRRRAGASLTTPELFQERLEGSFPGALGIEVIRVEPRRGRGPAGHRRASPASRRLRARRRVRGVRRQRGRLGHLSQPARGP